MRVQFASSIFLLALTLLGGTAAVPLKHADSNSVVTSQRPQYARPYSNAPQCVARKGGCPKASPPHISPQNVTANGTQGAVPSEASQGVIIAYYTDWTANKLPPENVAYDKITHVNYAFAIVTPDYKAQFNTSDILTRVVTSAHAKQVKVLISIGGWTGSKYFSPLAADANNRATFIDSTMKIVKDFSLDGVDIDWEYPGRQGDSCNAVDSQNDAANFLLLLKEMRAALDREYPSVHKEITLAVRIQPFDVPSGPMSDVSAYVPYVDRVNIMAYDINGSWSWQLGANAPFNGTLGFVQSANAWLSANMPANKIAMGIPFYGRSLIASSDMSGQSSIGSTTHDWQIPQGDEDDAPWADPCTPWSTTYSGVWKWGKLVSQGVLSGANFEAVAPWLKKWDEPSSTPWLYNPTTKAFISYDDPKSLGIKVDYVKKLGLAGVMLWEVHGDDTSNALLGALQGVRS